MLITKIGLAPHLTFSINPSHSSPPMLPLTRSNLLHDDPNSKTHYRDKKKKWERDKVQFVPIEAPITGSGKDLTGVDFDPDSNGFMLRFGNPEQNKDSALGKRPLPTAEKVDEDTYRKWVLKEERERRRFRRSITRNGKEIETWGSHKNGGVSLVVTVPPWTMKVLDMLEDDVRDKLLLETASVAGKRLQEVSGRTAWGAGCHLDTDIAHFHFQIPKVSPSGENWNKSRFRTGGPWLTGANRIEGKFPSLLAPKQRELLESHKARKGVLVDLEMSSAVDEFLEIKFQEMGFQREYQRSCLEYTARKKKAKHTEQERLLLREALKFFRMNGIWALASSAMSLAMWRLLPKELRVVVMASMRLTQIIECPSPRHLVKSVSLELIKRLSHLPEMEMEGPRR